MDEGKYLCKLEMYEKKDFAADNDDDDLFGCVQLNAHWACMQRASACARHLRGRSVNQTKGSLHATPIFHATFHAFPAACLVVFTLGARLLRHHARSMPNQLRAPDMSTRKIPTVLQPAVYQTSGAAGICLACERFAFCVMWQGSRGNKAARIDEGMRRLNKRKGGVILVRKTTILLQVARAHAERAQRWCIIR